MWVGSYKLVNFTFTKTNMLVGSCNSISNTYLFLLVLRVQFWKLFNFNSIQANRICCIDLFSIVWFNTDKEYKTYLLYYIHFKNEI